MQEQQFRVPVSLAKRGKENSQDIQAVHQITAEQFFAGKLIDAFVGGGNNADIDGDDLVITSASLPGNPDTESGMKSLAVLNQPAAFRRLPESLGTF